MIFDKNSDLWTVFDICRWQNWVMDVESSLGEAKRKQRRKGQLVRWSGGFAVNLAILLFFFRGTAVLLRNGWGLFIMSMGWWAVLPLLGAGIRTDFSKVAGVLYRIWVFFERGGVRLIVGEYTFLYAGRFLFTWRAQKKGYHCIPTLLTLNLILWKTQYKGTSLERIYQMFYISICFF